MRLEPSQRGQSGQPSPEPVSRTAAPEKTISAQTASAAYATRRTSRGVNVRRNQLMRSAHCVNPMRGSY